MKDSNKRSGSVAPDEYLAGISRPLDVFATTEPPLSDRARIPHPRVGEHGKGVVVISPVIRSLKVKRANHEENRLESNSNSLQQNITFKPGKSSFCRSSTGVRR